MAWVFRRSNGFTFWFVSIPGEVRLENRRYVVKVVRGKFTGRLVGFGDSCFELFNVL